MASFLQHGLGIEIGTQFDMFSSLSESGFIPTTSRNLAAIVRTIAFSSLSESGFIPTDAGLQEKSRRFLGSHLFQRVASFLLLILKFLNKLNRFLFSSLSESGFIPTSLYFSQETKEFLWFSSLSESGFIPTYVRQLYGRAPEAMFSSLSESGFIPTGSRVTVKWTKETGVLISFREWLHSYSDSMRLTIENDLVGSHLFQRVASFLQRPAG